MPKTGEQLVGNEGALCSDKILWSFRVKILGHQNVKSWGFAPQREFCLWYDDGPGFWGKGILGGHWEEGSSSRENAFQYNWVTGGAFSISWHCRSCCCWLYLSKVSLVFFWDRVLHMMKQKNECGISPISLFFSLDRSCLTVTLCNPQVGASKSKNLYRGRKSLRGGNSNPCTENRDCGLWWWAFTRVSSLETLPVFSFHFLSTLLLLLLLLLNGLHWHVVKQSKTHGQFRYKNWKSSLTKKICWSVCVSVKPPN